MAKQSTKQSKDSKVHPELLDRMPPCSIEAEMALIGSLMMMPSTIDEVESVVRADDFYDSANASIFAAMRDVHAAGKGCDLLIVVEHLKAKNLFDQIGGALYLNRIRNAVVTPAHAVYYANIVRDRSLARQVHLAAAESMHDVMTNGSDDGRGVVERFEQRAYAIAEKGVSASANVLSAHDMMFEAISRYDSGPEDVTGFVGTGFEKLDDMIVGLGPNELILIAGRPGHGKSCAGLAFGAAAAKAGHQGLFVSLEMGSSELADRWLSMEAEIDLHRLRALTISTKERERLVNAASSISQLPFWIEDAPIRTVAQIAALARRHKRQHGLKVLFIDYLQLIDTSDGGNRESRQEQVSRISRKLKNLARELKVPVVCLAQVNRQSTESNRMPKLSELRESGALEQDADKVIFVFRPKYEDIYRGEKVEWDEPAQFGVAKQRNGPCGPVQVMFRRSCGKFVAPAGPVGSNVQQFTPYPDDEEPFE